MIIMKQTKTELHFLYFSELHNVHFYEYSGTKKALTCGIFYWKTRAPMFTV